MKKTIKLFGFIAAAAMILVACNKEVNVDTPTFSHRVTIHVAQPETKTVINEGTSSATFTWSADDASRFYITENGVAGTGVSISSTDGYATMTLGATFETVTADSYVYKAVLAKNLTSSKKPRVPNSQTSSATSYDPNADVLVAKDLTFDNPQDEFSMQFMRPVVINKMTLKGLTEGETITTVTIKADANFIGYYDATNEEWTKDGDEIIVTVNQTVPSSGQIVVYFVSAPIEGATLTVTADTEDYTYSKSFTKTIDLIANQVTVFGVSSLSKVAKPNLAGNYLIVSKDDSNPWALMSACTGTVYAGVSTGIANATAIDLTDASADLSDFCINDYVWTLAKVSGGYTLQSVKSGKYVTIEKDSNEARESDTALTFTVSDEGNNQYNVMESVSGNNRILQYNYNGGDLRFAFYKNSQKDVYFVPVSSWKLRLATPANLNATTSGSTINVSWDAVENASGYIVTCTGQTDQSVAAGTLSASFTGLEEGDYTVTVSAVGTGDYATSLANTASVAIGALKITWNGTVNPATVSTGYTATYNGNYPGPKTGYYQDQGTKDATINYIIVSSTTPMFESTPTNVTLKATLGAGSAKDPLTYNVYACLVDASGDEIASTVTVVTNKITEKNGSDYEVTIPVTGVTTAYGFKVRHMKEDGWNVRYYGLSLAVEGGSGGSGGDTPVEESTLLELDLTTKEFGNSAYNSTLAYGDWTIVNGANNNKGWEYFKMGGKSTTLADNNPCYIYSTKAISAEAGSVTVHLPAGSLSKTGMGVNEWGVYVYSDANLTNQVDYVAGGEITNSEGTFTFEPSTGVTWASGSYFKVSWDLANTTTTNGIVCVDKVTVLSASN